MSFSVAVKSKSKKKMLLKRGRNSCLRLQASMLQNVLSVKKAGCLGQKSYNRSDATALRMEINEYQYENKNPRSIPLRKMHRLSSSHPSVWHPASLCVQSPFEKVTLATVAFHLYLSSQTSLHNVKTVLNPIEKHRKEKIESP